MRSLHSLCACLKFSLKSGPIYLNIRSSNFHVSEWKTLWEPCASGFRWRQAHVVLFDCGCCVSLPTPELWTLPHLPLTVFLGWMRWWPVWWWCCWSLCSHQVVKTHGSWESEGQCQWKPPFQLSHWLVGQWWPGSLLQLKSQEIVWTENLSECEFYCLPWL